MKSRNLKRRTGLILLTSLAALTVSIGCRGNNQVVIHPIEQTDIVVLQAGDTFVAPKNGAYLSEKYILEVMKAKIDK
jgi:hypothetical protein